ESCGDCDSSRRVSICTESRASAQRWQQSSFQASEQSPRRPVAASVPQFFAGTVPIFSVPSGQRLVIEHASARCFTSLGQRVTHLVLTAETQPSSAGFYELIPISTGSSSGFDFFSASQSIKVYASAGTSVLVFAQKSDSGPVGACSFQISGHLFNVP